MSISRTEFSLLMAFLMSVCAIAIDALLPALGIIGQELAVTHPNHPQLLIMGIFAGMAVGELVAGPLSDAWGRKPVLYIGAAIYLLGSFICYLSADFAWLLAGRVIQGFGGAAPYITVVSVVRDRYAGRDMARIMSIVMMIFILVPAVAPSIGQAVMHLSGWRGIFVLYMLYALVACLWVFLRLDETLPQERRVPLTRKAFIHGLKVIAGNRTTTIYSLCMGFCFGSFMGYLGASQQIFQIQFGVGEAFSLYFGGLALVLGAASLVNSSLVMRVGMRRICRRSMLAIIYSSFIFLVLHIVVENITLPMFVAYAAVLFFAFGLCFGNLNAIALEPMGDIAGMATAITGCVISLLSLVIGTFIGQSYDNTLIPISSGFLFFGVITYGLMVIEGRAGKASAEQLG